MANLFYTPQFVIAGENALDMAKGHLKKFDQKTLIVTDEVMVNLGNVKKLTDVLDEINIEYEIYSGINSEPDNLMIDKGVEIYKAQNCGSLIGIGGGSPLDAMKAIGAVIANGGNITEYMGKKIINDLPQTCAIPTTAGTGSEATAISIINNLNTGVKMLLKDPKLMACLAIIDPVFTLTAPKNVTAATGVDALTHALESYTSKKSFSMTDTHSISAIRRIFNNLLEAYENGENLDARNEMAIAAFEAGIAFNCASVTVIHGMSRPIGALFHVPHGLSNAMLLAVCLEYIKEDAIEEFCQLAKTIGVFSPEMTDLEGADAFVAATKELLAKLNIMTLAEFGIDKEEFFKQLPKMADDALTSGSPQNTRRAPSKEEIIELYKALW